MLGILIPEVEGTVATRSAERTVDRVEGDGVDGVDVADIAVVRWRLTVALETEVRAGVLVLDVLNGAATFDTAHGKARRVGEAADYPRLPLQGGLHSLVELGGVVEVDDVDVSVSCTDDQELVLDVHRVDTLLAFHSGDRSRLSEIPILDSLIPRTGNKERLRCISGVGNHLAASDRRVVCGDLDRGSSIRGEIEHTSSLVSAGSDNLGSILRVISNEIGSMAICMRVTLTGDQQQFNTGPSCSKRAFPSLCPCSLIS